MVDAGQTEKDLHARIKELQALMETTASLSNMEQQIREISAKLEESCRVVEVDTSDRIKQTINNVSSCLADVAQDAMYQITYVLNQPEQRHLVDRKADLVFRVSAAQLDLLIKDFKAGKDVTGTVEACTQMLCNLMGGDEDGLEPLTASPETIKDIVSSVVRCSIEFGKTFDGYPMVRSFHRLASCIMNRVELSDLLCGLILATIEWQPVQQSRCIRTNIFKLLSKWCKELIKRRTQLRTSDIVDVFNECYVALAEKNNYLNDAIVQVMDKCLELVVLHEGDVVFDAIRRLATPHARLSGMI